MHHFDGYTKRDNVDTRRFFRWLLFRSLYDPQSASDCVTDFIAADTSQTVDGQNVLQLLIASGKMQRNTIVCVIETKSATLFKPINREIRTKDEDK